MNKELQARTEPDSSTTAAQLSSANLAQNPVLAAADIINGNKIIGNSQFSHNGIRMLIDNDSRAGHSDEYIYSQLKYHSSWDWLMPVCKKLDYLVDDKIIEFSNDFEFWCNKLDDAITRTYEIQPVFKIVIEFIEWFNAVQR